MRIANFLAIAALAVAPAVQGLGINCRGSFWCFGDSGKHVGTIASYILKGIDNSRVYSNGYHIACADNFCAFLQGTNGKVTGGEIRSMIQRLVDHHCGDCGSVPWDTKNNPNVNGILTVNYVSETANPCNNQLCPVGKTSPCHNQLCA